MYLYWILDHLKVHTTLGWLTMNSYWNTSLTSRGPGSLTQLQFLIFLAEMRMRCQDNNRTTTHFSFSSMASLEWVCLQWRCHFCRHCHPRYHLGQVWTLTTIRAWKKGGWLLFADQQLMANEKTMKLVSLMLQMPDQPFEWTLLGQWWRCQGLMFLLDLKVWSDGTAPCFWSVFMWQSWP